MSADVPALTEEVQADFVAAVPDAPVAAAAVTKKGKRKATTTAAVAKDKKGSKTSDDDEDEDEDGANKGPQISEEERATCIAKMRRLLQFQRKKLALEYTPDKRKVHQVSAAVFTKHAIAPDTVCIVCQAAIMGGCSTCYIIEHEGAKHAVHADCFVCTKNMDPEHVCGKSPLVKDEDEQPGHDDDDELEGEHVCYVETLGRAVPLPVCDDHIDLRNLDIPRYETEDTKQILQFYREKGFVVIQSGKPAEFWDSKAEWISKVLGMMVGWTDKQRLDNMKTQGWDFHFKDIPGFVQQCLGVTGKVASTKYAADVLQSAEAWDMRFAVFDLALPLMRGNNPTVMAGMAPLMVQTHYSQIQTRNLQFCPSETRQTNERDDNNKNGRVNAIQIINGLAAATACDNFSIIVCPQDWELKAGGVTSFERQWKVIERRQEAGGRYEEGHWAEDIPTPVRLRPGDVILFNRARPFRFLPNTDNSCGIFLNWHTGVPKELTQNTRADAVTEGVVLRKNSTMGSRYVNSNCASKVVIPRNFGTLVTPVTTSTLGQYAALIFGTNYKDFARWPKKYKGYASQSLQSRSERKMIRGRDDEEDEDDLDVVPVTDPPAAAEAATPASAKKSKVAPAPKKAPEKKEAPAATTTAAAKKKVAPAKKVEEPAPVDEEDVEMATLAMDTGPDEEEDEAAPPLKKSAAAAAAAAPAKKAKPTFADIYGEPYMDAKEALESCAKGWLPSRLRFNPAWLPADADRCPIYWSTLWTTKDRKCPPEDNDIFFASETFPKGTIIVVNDDAPRLQLFDAFSDLGLDEATEHALRDQVATNVAAERATIKVTGNDAKLGRHVQSFCLDTKLGASNFKKDAVTPPFVGTILQNLSDRNLLGQPGDKGAHRITMITIEGRSECINPFSFKDLIEGTPSYIICLGGMGRTLRIRNAGVKSDEKKTKSRGGILADLRIFSGLGIELPGFFFQKSPAEQNCTIEVPALPGSTGKDAATANLSTIPFCLLVVSTAKDPSAKKKAGAGAAAAGKGSRSKKSSAVNEKAAALANANAAKLVALKADIMVMRETHGTRIAGDSFLTTRYQALVKSLQAANKGGRGTVEELHTKMADFYQKLTGQDYLLTISNRVDPEEDGDGDNDDQDEGDEDGDDDEAVVVKPAAGPKKAPPPPKKPAPTRKAAPKGGRKSRAADMETVMVPDDEDPTKGVFSVPETTRKHVITESGQLARRSARSARPVTDTKLSSAQEAHEVLLRRTWKTNESARRRNAVAKGLTFVPRTFERYREQQERTNLSSRKGAALDDAVDMDLENEDDGDEYALGDELGFDAEDPEERAAYAAGSGGSSSSSGEEEDEDDDEEGDGVGAGDIDVLSKRIRVAQEAVEILYTKHAAIVDGKQKVKELFDLYEQAVDAGESAENSPEDEVLVLALETCLAKFKSAIEARLPPPTAKPIRKTVPPKPGAEALGSGPAAAAVPKQAPVFDLDALDGDERIVLEGFNAGVAPEVTAQLIASLTEVIVGFIATAHHIPGLNTPVANALLGMARAKLARLVEAQTPVKSRINSEKLAAWKEVEDKLLKYLKKAMAQQAAPMPSPPLPIAPASAPVAAVPVAVPSTAEAAAAEENDVDEAEDDEEEEEADGDDNEEEGPMEIDADAAALSDQEYGEEEGGAAEDNDSGPADDGAVGSAEDATKDKAAVQEVRATPVPKPLRADSLDVAPESAAVPAAVAPAAAASAPSNAPTMAVLARNVPNHPFCLLGNDLEKMKKEIFNDYKPPASTTPDAYFKAQFIVRELPPNWKQVLEANGLRPLQNSLMGKPESLLWPAVAANGAPPLGKK